MRSHFALSALVLALSTSPVLATAPTHGAAVAWLPAAGDADIDKAFAQARGNSKPVLLYWGAKWCPPCNQLKAQLFNRQDFIERSRSFVAVSIDGDLPGAQKLGARFKVRGYPTLILFNAAGQELTRLPGEADAAQIMQGLQQGMAGGRPVKDVLADAQAGKKLSDSEWRLLAFYSWDTDESALVPEAERATLLATLAAKATDEDAATRLWLKTLAISDDSKGVKADSALRERVQGVLKNPAVARRHMDVLTNFARDITKALDFPNDASRVQFLASFDTALLKLEQDVTLSRADRLTALQSRVDLALMDENAKVPEALIKDAQSTVARMDQEITDGYERQAVITSGARLLFDVGLKDESDALLNANLAKSHSPYYLMSSLASNAKKRGDKTAALNWYEQAYNKSVGPATRLQWGASYLGALVELTPQDSARIEKAASLVISDAAAQSNAFYERSARSMQRVGQQLNNWNAKGEHAEPMRRLQSQLSNVCGKLDAADSQRATCNSLLKPASSS